MKELDPEFVAKLEAMEDVDLVFSDSITGSSQNE
jgi:hypothetical protein